MPIRLAHVVEATTGGVARHVIDLVTHLDPAEFSCVLYLSFERPDSWTEPLRALRQRGVTIREISMARVPNPTAVRQLTGWAQRDAIDILHLHSAKAGYLGRQTELSRPLIYTPHAFPFQRTTDWRRPLYRMIECRMAARTTRIITVSAGEYDEALEAGLPPEKLTIIPNGLDLAQWPLPTPDERRQARQALGISDDETLIGAMARLTPQKGIDLLLQAAEDILPDFPTARIIIWGDGPQRAMLERMARRLRLRRVTFAGSTRTPREAYMAMDIFCAPSRWEAGPYAVLEAMASGVPVVAADVAGHADAIVEDETGLLAPPELPGPIAGALRALLVDEDPRKDMGLAGRLRVTQHFSVETMVAATANVYREVAEKYSTQ